MFWTYLRRELLNRKRQTAIVAAGLALAIGLVLIVSGVASGVKAAQSKVFQSIYGVGTDISVTKSVSQSGNSGRPNFRFGARNGGSGSRTKLSQSRLTVSPGSAVLPSSDVATVGGTASVSAATGVLALQNVSFSGSVKPGATNRGGSSQGGLPQGGSPQRGHEDSGAGAGGGFGGGSFNIDSFTVTGIPVNGQSVGPLTSAKLTKGRTFRSADATAHVTVLDASYAKSTSKTVGDKITIGGKSFAIIGIVASTTSTSTTGSNTYVPLGVAQSMSDEKGKVTSIYVSAKSAADVNTIQAALKKELPGTTVATQSQLASNVSGSLGTASSLVAKLGTWLSIAVLAAAFLIAVLFTISGVTRRTREFGTLKAIGWSDRRIVAQVAGESLTQGIIGGIAGAVVGLAGIFVINLVGPTVSANTDPRTRMGQLPQGGTGGGFPGSGQGGPPAGFGAAARNAATSLALHVPVSVGLIGLAAGLAVLGGLVAGALGGWRAARLRPAEALRSVG